MRSVREEGDTTIPMGVYLEATGGPVSFEGVPDIILSRIIQEGVVERIKVIERIRELVEEIKIRKSGG